MVQHYFLIIFPIFILLFAQEFLKLEARHKALFYILLSLYLTVNLYTLINSQVKYPLYQKINLVKNSLGVVGNSRLAIYSSTDPYVQGGGWTELYNLQGHPAAKSYWYDYWDWIYQAYSLYPGPIQKEDPKKIVIFEKEGEKIERDRKVIAVFKFKDLEMVVLDNQNLNLENGI